MADLSETIRAKLAQLDEDLTGALTYGPVEAPMAALTAVLDLHESRGGSAPYTWCGSCRGDSWPCRTVRALAEKLGVEIVDE